MSKTPKKFEEALILLADKLKGSQYAIRGTASLVLQGFDMNVDDIDILCDKKTALLSNSLLGEYLVDEVAFKETDKFKSYFGKFEIEGVKVEVMGEWEIKDSKGKWHGPYNASDRIKIVYEGKEIYVTSASHELKVFADMGRWTAFHKIKDQMKPEEKVSEKNSSNKNVLAKKLLIIDTFNFLHRAYHAIPQTFVDKNGDPVNAVYGFTSMIISLLAQVRPDYVVAAMDSEKPTFRVGDFTGYKAHRKPTEEALAVQIPKVAEVLDAFGIKRFLIDGYEADDLIGTIAKKYSSDLEILIVSNDRDLWQLAGGNVLIGLPGGKGEVEFIGDKETHARMGFDPAQIADYKGLRGDPSDNIPGVFGIGEKTATKLIQDFGSIEEIYKNIDKVKPDSLREKLLNCAETAMMSKKLAKLIMDAPVDVKIEDCKYTEFNHGKVKEILEKYNFKSLLKRLGFEVSGDQKKKDTEKDEVSKDQLSLF